MHRRVLLLFVFSLVVAAPAARADDRAACAIAAGDDAIAACSRLIMSGTSGAELAQAHRNRCAAWLRNGEFDLAVAGCSEAIRLDPADAAAHGLRGNALRQNGEHDRAIVDYDAALRLDQRSAVAHNDRGLAWAGQRDDARALVDYGEAIRLDPDYAAPLANRGLLYERQGNAARARADFERALALPASRREDRWVHAAARERLAALAQPRPVARSQPSEPAAKGAKPKGRAVSPGRDSRPRLALVMGNADYVNADPPPNQPTRHAAALARELRLSGFDVELAENLTKAATQRVIAGFKAKIKPGSTVLVFYSGYGIESGRQTFMIPVDAQIWVERDVARHGVSIDTLLADLHAQGAAVKLAIVDASRRNPFERRFRSVSAGLGAIAAPAGSLVLSAAPPGQVVNESAGDHSLFISELLKEMRAPSATAEQIFNYTRIGVSRASEAEQVPWIASSLAEDFSFAAVVRPRR
jgi:tetratricopeptide (TPR) repeat protein